MNNQPHSNAIMVVFSLTKFENNSFKEAITIKLENNNDLIKILFIEVFTIPWYKHTFKFLAKKYSLHMKNQEDLIELPMNKALKKKYVFRHYG